MCSGCGGEGFVTKGGKLRVQLDANNLKHRDVTFDDEGHKLIDYLHQGIVIVRLRYLPKVGNYEEKEEMDIIKLNISLYEAMYGVNQVYNFANGRKSQLKTKGPIQNGHKIEHEGIVVELQVNIPDPKQICANMNSKESNEFEKYMRMVDKVQQAYLKGINNKIINSQINKNSQARNGNCVVL